MRLAYSPAIGYASVDSNGDVIEFLAAPCCQLAESLPYGRAHDCQDDSHDVRFSPTRIRPYQARTVHYLGRLIYVSNAGTGNRVNVFTLHGTYGKSPSRLVCQSYRSR